MVDVLSQIGAVTRELRIDDVDGEQSHVQSLEQAHPSPIDDVWDAVTSPERIQRWFLPVSGDFRVGRRFQFEGQAGGEVLECEPPVDDAGLLGLSLHLGAVEGSLSPSEAEAWAATDEGKQFYRGAADGWGSAHEASHTD